MGAHPFLTLTLFIAMFERDHGPLEYQKAYGRAMEHISLPYPDIATWARARRRPAHPGEPPAYRTHPDPVADPGRTLVRVTAAPVVPLDLLCASGTSYFGRPAVPYVPGVQGIGVVKASAVHPPGARAWFATSAGMAPGDGSQADAAPSPTATSSRSRPISPPRRWPRSACQGSPRGWR